MKFISSPVWIDGLDATISIFEIVHADLGAALRNEKVISVVVDTVEGNTHYYAVVVTDNANKRSLTPKEDGLGGLAKWVHENAHDLVLNLGVGHHYGDVFNDEE